MAIDHLTDTVLADQAEAAAARAAARAAVSVHALEAQEDLDAAERLLSEIWEVGDEPLVQSSLMRALLYGGNYVSGAFAEGRLVGTSIGFLGRQESRLHLHSHITGVAKAMQSRSVGFALKQHQRAWALRNGLDEIVWTFDPLVRRNGYFNINKLGAQIIDYKPNFYGSMRDGINGDDDTDRCVVVWDAGSERAIEAADGRQLQPAADPDRTKVVLIEEPDGSPTVDLGPGEMLAAQIPYDIVQMRYEDPGTAAAWRGALREVLVWAFARDYAVTGMTKSGAYVLSRPS